MRMAVMQQPLTLVCAANTHTSNVERTDERPSGTVQIQNACAGRSFGHSICYMASPLIANVLRLGSELLIELVEGEWPIVFVSLRRFLVIESRMSHAEHRTLVLRTEFDSNDGFGSESASFAG